MKQGTVWVLMAGLVLAFMVFFAVAGRVQPGGGSTSQLAGGGGTSQPAAQPGEKAAPDAIKISIASAATKQEWLHQAVAAFNAGSKSDGALQSKGKSIFVEILQEVVDGKPADYRSGTMVSDTVQGKIKPTILSPGEESWIATLEKEWKAVNRKQITTGEAPVLVRTPLVVAMWQSRASALNCWPTPGPDCSWEHLRKLAASPNGWELAGKPAWGKFKLGYGYVGESNSGTLSVVIMCMIGAGKTSGLTVDDVGPGNGCGQMIAAIEQAKVHSGNRSGWLLDRLRTGGPDYLDAVITNEAEVVAFNKNRSGNVREPLVAVYPQDGTVMFGQPFAILDAAPWVTGDQVEAAGVFRHYLLAVEQQEKVLALGLRPARSEVKLGAPLDAEHGAIPQATLLTLAVPDALVVDRIIEVWHKVKKHAVIAMVFDKSGSMAGEKMNASLSGAKEFITRMDSDDELIWIPFDEKTYKGTQGKVAQIGEKLVSEVNSTPAGGGTALYDAVLLAHDTLAARRRAAGDSVRYGIVVLSDGKDTNSTQTLAQLEARLKPLETDPTGIQIHTIAIGTDSDDGVLKKIANSAHGRFWKGQTTRDMVAIYRDIATYY